MEKRGRGNTASRHNWRALGARHAYIAATMAHDIAHPAIADESAEATQPFDRRSFWRAIVAGFLLMGLAGGFLWARYGSLIFFDMLSSLQGCF